MNTNSESSTIRMTGMTVKQLIEMLTSLSAECQEWEISCCGCSDFWLHLCGAEKTEVFPREGMPKQMQACFLNTAPRIVAGYGLPQTVLREL